MKKVLLFVILSWLTISYQGYCNYTEIIQYEKKDTIDAQRLGFASGKDYILKSDIDLKGNICVLPKNVTIKAMGGTIKNGVIAGQNTKIIYNKNAVFDNIDIEGSWSIPIIKTSLFKDLTSENSLKNVFALTNPGIKNKLIIEKGVYTVKSTINKDACLTLNSNTELIIHGVIKIVPNTYPFYDIIHVEGNNIIINGDGTIIGDKFTHIGKDGEWGMGIRVQKSNNVKIVGLTVKECWGDCIYVGGGSTNVRIEQCELDHGRRQGISVTKANGVSIEKCKISNVGGTPPEYAIDIEPDPGDTVNNILIKKVEAIHCKGGFLVYGRAQCARAGRITIRDCKLSDISKIPVNVLKCDEIVVDNCKINLHPSQQAIRCEDTDSVVIKNNHSKYSPFTEKKEKGVELTREQSVDPIIMGCKYSELKNNKKR